MFDDLGYAAVYGLLCFTITYAVVKFHRIHEERKRRMATGLWCDHCKEPVMHITKCIYCWQMLCEQCHEDLNHTCSWDRQNHFATFMREQSK